MVSDAHMVTCASSMAKSHAAQGRRAHVMHAYGGMGGGGEMLLSILLHLGSECY